MKFSLHKSGYRHLPCSLSSFIYFKYTFLNMKGRLVVGALLAPAAVFAQNTTTKGLLSSGNVDLGAWAGAYAKVTAFVAQLTNEEKITIITGGSVGSSVDWTALEFKDGTESVQGRFLNPGCYSE
jgi:ABC-type Fe3+-siderophore transport system permease subunit